MTNLVAGMVLYVTVTAYCPCDRCCGKWADGITASGRPAVEGRTVAANWAPFGTVVQVQGFDVPKVVEDRMAKRFSDRLDIYFRSHKDALAFGKRKLRVRILETKGNE